jgi:hypothetical protein
MEWHKKMFIKEHVCTFFYMPLNMGNAMRRIDKRLRSVAAEMQDYMCLSDHTSKWNMDLYVAVDREIPGVDTQFFSGKYYSLVYDGDFRETGKWCSDYEKKAKEKGLSIKELYMWYTTCPKCAKKYGHNYVVILSEVE